MGRCRIKRLGTMTDEKKQRVQDLAHQIAELIANTDGISLLDSIDALAIVEATMLNQVRDAARKSVMDGVVGTIKAIVKC